MRPAALRQQAELSFYKPSIRLILEAQSESGAIPWLPGGDLDAWDMVEAAMGLAAAGEVRAAWRAYRWLSERQLADGSFWSLYRGEKPVQLRREAHHAAYLAVGLWHQWQITGDLKMLAKYWPAAVRGLEFALALQSPHGEITWARDAAGKPMDDSLITACSNLCKSLECGIAGEALFGRSRPDWRRARQRLRSAVRHSPQRFDRNWKSKRRFSMDWFYPVLGGVFSVAEGRARLERRWAEFVQPGLGCRCVSDAPWVTVAESCELVLALCALGLKDRAAEVFSWLHRHRDGQGRYWTGYVWPDRAFWPEEKPTWTAAVVLLAADALYGWTSGSSVLTAAQPSAAARSLSRASRTCGGTSVAAMASALSE